MPPKRDVIIIVAVVVVVGVLISLVPVNNYLVTHILPTTTYDSHEPSIGSRNVQVRAIGSFSSWQIQSYSAAGVLSLIQSMRSVIGPFNLFGFLAGPQIPGSILNGSISLNNYLLSAEQDAGGQIVPDLNLDFYANPGNNYCDPLNSSWCGPSFFYYVSSQFLSLSAISQGQRVVFLSSWDTFSRQNSPSVVQSVFTHLLSQGWKQLAVDDLPPYFPDYGYASYIVTSLQCQNATPFCKADTEQINQSIAGEPYLLAHFVQFGAQIQNSPNPPTPFFTFVAQMNSSEQATALTSIASSQVAGNYDFIYPVYITTSRNNTGTYVFDAWNDLQPNGQPFIDLEESLILNYN